MKLSERPDLARAADLFADAARISREYTTARAQALADYGDHGAEISVCVRMHFPECTKGHLRALARNVHILTKAGLAARPARVHKATMLKLAREIAARDGIGFYGIH